MSYFVVALLLLGSFFFWGVGLAWFVTPRSYRRFFLIFAPVVGLTLQSAVVWLGVYADWEGTESYGRLSWLLPSALLAAALWHRRRIRAKRPAFFGALLALAVFQLGLLVLPAALSGHRLTTASMGSLDAADYAAGARVFQEFARSDRSGFIGQSEVVSVGNTDNFYDYWLRTNHFTPSALIALNGSTLGLKPHQITSVVTMVMLAAALPMVFWLARSGFGYRSWVSGAITLIYALNPINWYAVYHVAPAQILAANAIALLTWCGIVQWRRSARGVLVNRSYTGLLLVAYALILGSYNFIVVVCLAPAAAYAGVQTLRSWTFRPFFTWTFAMTAPLAAAALLFLDRTIGVGERFALFKDIGFGWAIPVFSPEGWLGLVDGTWLRGFAKSVRVPLAVAAGVGISAGWFVGLKMRRASVWVALGCTAPVLVGYAFLELRASVMGTLASYDAYKLFAVFYPSLLAAFCYGLHLLASAHRTSLRKTGLVIAGGLLLGNAFGEWRIVARMTRPQLLVDPALAELGSIERMEDVRSVNLRISDGWDRLWINALLLQTPHYFENAGYEARRKTALNGEWDLIGPFFRIEGGDDRAVRHPSDAYTLVRRTSESFIEASLGEGWANPFRDDPRSSDRTRWVEWQGAVIRINNPRPQPMQVTLTGQVRALQVRDCTFVVNGSVVDRFDATTEPKRWHAESVVLPPGQSTIEIRTEKEPDVVGGRVKRPLSLALDGLDIRVIQSAPAQQ